MAWDQHGSRRYYTRSHKKAGKVTREYFGKGAEAKLAAALDESRRERQQAERQTLKADLPNEGAQRENGSDLFTTRSATRLMP